METNRYISVTKGFTIRGSVTEQNLIDLQTGRKYIITADQFDFLTTCDGSRTLGDILSDYDNPSQHIVLDFLANLSAIGAIEFGTSNQKRFLPTVLLPDIRLLGVHLEATSLCNMRCAHCYQGNSYTGTDDLNIGEIDDLANQMQEMQVENVSLSGGEPLMNKLTFEIARIVEEKDIRISSIFTNGWLIDSQVIQKILAWQSRATAFVSLDAVDAEGMRFRGFDKPKGQKVLMAIISNISELMKAGIPTIINTVMTPCNIHHLEEMYETMRELGVQSWRIGFPKKAGFFKQNSLDYAVPWDTMSSACLRLIKKHLSLDQPFDLQIEFLFRKALFDDFKLASENDFVCDYEERRESCCIKSNGDVTSCAYCNDMAIGNIRQQALSQIWYSPEMQSTKNVRVRDVKECHGCVLSPLCATGCRANAYFLNGDFRNSKDDQACKSVQFFPE